jgi:Ca2+-binding EF-hand superfamily protein
MRQAGVLAVFLAVVAAGDAAAQAFNRADTNHDGFVTFVEARGVMRTLNQVHFNRCDLDRDGRLNLKEYNCVLGIYDALNFN